uniref:GABA transporter 1-like n=1 Tax=Fragaria vesca subsp. vesca TaxID=101020 RepID=UPI0005CB72D0|nr:PREDICTED: GABA transporter 1-like [Fragaria vesca subsp. vesca]
MGTVAAPYKMELASEVDQKQKGVVAASSPPKQLDAGALFVLKSQGSWLHVGYHLTTSIVAPVLLSLPFAMALIGWVGGVICVALAALVTFYSYTLLSLVLEHQEKLGHRQLRFRDMARDILGPAWGKYFVGPLQFWICYGAVIACTLLGGQSLKVSASTYTSQLHHCQYYQRLIYESFIRLSNEYFHQATLAPPVKGKMFKGLCVCYSVIVTTYFSVAMSGYWAFGNQAMGTVLSNFMGVDKPLLPTWFLLMTNVFTLLQVLAVTVVYLQPTNEVFEKKFADPKMDQFSVRNVVPRLIFRSLTVVVATFFAAMLPFFGDIMALFGAFGCIPLDFILPMIFYNVSFKPSKQSLIFWVNTLIAGVSFLLVGVGAVASVRQIFLDAKTYRLFANM